MKNKLLLVFALLAMPCLAFAQSWQFVGSSAAISTATNYTPVVVDNNGTPYVACINSIGTLDSLVLFKYNGTSWSQVGSGFVCIGNYLALAIDNNGTPYVAYQDAYSGNRTSVRKYSNGWVQVGATGFSTGVPHSICLAIDGTGTPYVAYQDNGIGTGGAAVLKYNGNAWVVVGTLGFANTQVNYVSLALDGNGTPYFTYVDGGNLSISIWKYNGSSWVQLNTYGYYYTDYFTATAIDGSGTPYVAFQNSSGNISVIRYNGISWQLVGAASFAAGNTPNLSIALDGSGTPYVIYKDGGNSNYATVKKYNGSSWVTVGSAGFSSGSVSYPSIAIQKGTAYVAYNSGGAHVEKFTSLYPIWTGATSTDWNTAANWSTGAIPASGDGVSIPAGVTNMPVISSGTNLVNNLAQAPGDTITLSGAATLGIAGNVNDSGMIKGTGGVVLNGTGSQLIAGNGTMSNLTLNNTAGAIIKSGSNIKITGIYTNTAGTLTTDSALTLVSNAAGTASIGFISAGTISGKVNVQQYIPGGRRAFRFFGHPFSTSIALSQLENNMDITGAGGSANGFTNSGSNAPSAFWYNQATGIDTSTYDPGWTAFTSTNGSGANAWMPYEGIRVLVRGAQGEGLNGNTYTPSPVTFTMSGPVNQGSISVPFTIGGVSHYSVLGNPYPSPADIGIPIYAAKQAGTISGSAFYVWNAESQLQGSYVTVPIVPATYPIAGNAAFIIKAATAGSLSFTEYNKASSGAALFKSTADNGFTKLSVYDSQGNAWDALYISFNQDAANALEDRDATKMHNTALDFYSLSADGNKLSIDARPYVSGQVVPLGLQTSVQQTYVIKADALNIPAGTQLMLHDKYLNQYQPLIQGSEYAFTVTNDIASQGDNRFELSTVGVPTALTAISTGNNALVVSIAPNPATDNTVVGYSGADKYVQIYVADITGRVVYTVAASTKDGSVTIPLQNLSSGYYMVTTQCGNRKVTGKLIKN